MVMNDDNDNNNSNNINTYLDELMRSSHCGTVSCLFALASIFVKMSCTPPSSQGTATVGTS